MNTHPLAAQIARQLTYLAREDDAEPDDSDRMLQLVDLLRGITDANDPQAITILTEALGYLELV